MKILNVEMNNKAARNPTHSHFGVSKPTITRNVEKKTASSALVFLDEVEETSSPSSDEAILDEEFVRVKGELPEKEYPKVRSKEVVEEIHFATSRGDGFLEKAVHRRQVKMEEKDLDSRSCTSPTPPRPPALKKPPTGASNSHSLPRIKKHHRPPPPVPSTALVSAATVSELYHRDDDEIFRRRRCSSYPEHWEEDLRLQRFYMDMGCEGDARRMRGICHTRCSNCTQELCSALLCHDCGSNRRRSSYHPCRPLQSPPQCLHSSPSSSCCYVSRSLPLSLPYYELKTDPKYRDAEVEERIQRLEGDKDTLHLQVSVLSEQIEAQSDKINELERMLRGKREKLQYTEEQLQKELLTRGGLETQKVELLTEINNLKLQQVTVDKENINLKDKLRQTELEAAITRTKLAEEMRRKPPHVVRSGLSTPGATSTPISSPLADSPASTKSVPNSPAPSIVSSAASPRAWDRVHPKTPPPSGRHRIEHISTLPRRRESATETDSSDGGRQQRKGVAFGKGFSLLQFRGSGKRSCSAPNLADKEQHIGEAVITSTSVLSNSHREKQHPHGIKKILSKLKRSNSGNLEGDNNDSEFKRGGIRASAAPRLGYSKDYRCKLAEAPFILWDTAMVCDWLQELGLGLYVPEARRWLKSGEQLLKATGQELEKELQMKHPLHRKKLRLVLQTMTLEDEPPAAAQLDPQFILRWLDDVGLPQYKESFIEAKVDGHMLEHLTVEDLAIHLKVTNLLHHLSIKRAIQELKIHNFQANCLTRRSSPEDSQTPSPEDVARWTNHRVMEWLRAVDLSEYAPNLRGSGVHGALMIHEPKFTSEVMSSLLSIPSSKTLLRRHLSTHFNELVGKIVVLQKRQAEGVPSYTPLTPTTKVKITRRGQFTLMRKRSKSEYDLEELVCPEANGTELESVTSKRKE